MEVVVGCPNHVDAQTHIEMRFDLGSVPFVLPFVLHLSLGCTPRRDMIKDALRFGFLRSYDEDQS